MRRLLTLPILLFWLAAPASEAAAPSPVKVFVLAGQSNMEGQAVADLEGKDYNQGLGTLRQLLRDPAKGSQFKHLTNSTGWVARNDVWVRYQRENRPLLRGPLTIGFTVYGDPHHFGPELQFGNVVGDHFDSQVLLIKTAWGGKSLFQDFRPPSSGGNTGPYYLKMLAEIRAALTNLATDFPAYANRGYELAGFVWYHGWNDGVDPKRAVPAYETNLVNLIRDLRRDLAVPSLPVVIGELTGPWLKAPAEWEKLRQAQRAAATRPEFQGNVAFVETRDYVRRAEESPNPTHGHHEFGNAETYFLVGDALGRGMVRLLKERRMARENELPPYRRMDFGPALFWTYEVAPGNIAQKGIAIRLDDGPGGVAKGRAWMIYDHDLMRMAAATTGDFVNWKGIAFDGSHGTHTALTGVRHWVNPVGPGWASPEGTWEDVRLVGRDGRRYGPLPREWAHYEGLYRHGAKVVLAATIGGTRVLESPGWIGSTSLPVFTRTFNIGAAPKPLLLRVAPNAVRVALVGQGTLREENGFWIAELPGGAQTRLFISGASESSLAAIVQADSETLALDPLLQGGPSQWREEISTTSVPGGANGSFVAETFPLPTGNPWHSWMRPGGFDFAPDGRGIIMATWNGDVWRVDGMMDPAPAPLRWRRIASGLFQPLGVKFRGKDPFILCRDQLVRLRDLNGDGETDFVENFNNDHQVTEHFHEFAMGLQVDGAGNFYYAKSGRHALDSVVPHHGTLLRVSADGRQTDILATGFRAANGVCLNDDGTFFVTDQEGFWTPKNRINRVKAGGFYGNMFGYTSVTNTADAAMEPPMVWITNAKDRSPAELVWVPTNAWGTLGGSLLNLSYGTGRLFLLPHEKVGDQWQGAVCELPLPAFATGIMRGRFAPDGALYACGLFGWAGNATASGGFHRIRRTEKPAHVPLAIHATVGGLELTFSEPLHRDGVSPDAFAFKVWSLKRSANYGSKHYDERSMAITAVRLEADLRTLILKIPELRPTDSYELKFRLVGQSGEVIERAVHGTIHRLAER
jgi:hypothetical protein